MDTNQPEVKIIDSSYYSLGFPTEIYDKLIRRENYITKIEDDLAHNAMIAFIEGDEDSGKTTLCAQFVRKYPKQSISVFFNPLNTLDYQLDYYYSNVVAQIKYLLNEPFEDSVGYVSFEEYRSYILQLRKTLKRGTSKIYLIIDGLEDKINEHSDFINQLFTILPIGEDFIRIIISGHQKDFLSICTKIKVDNTSPIHLTGFSPTEMIEYLETPATNELDQLFKITKGFPGRLKTLKRLIQREGYSLDKIDKTTTYKQWLELDCNSIKNNDSHTNVILSLLSLTKNTYDIRTIALVCSEDESKIKKKISEIPILTNSDDRVSFISIGHKKYMANLLRGHKRDINELLISYHSSQETISSKLELSQLFADKKDWPKIIEITNDEFLENILETTGNLQKVNDSLELGVKASTESNRYSDMLRFSIQGSIVNELDNYLFGESEISARIAINDFVGAISLAESAVLRIDRLKLLALVAKKQKELNGKIDEELNALLLDLYNSSDLSGVGSKIYDIVADLIYAIPSMAIDLIEKSSGEASEKNINDWIVAKLSAAAIDSNLKDSNDDEGQKKLEAIQNLNNPAVKKIQRAVSFMVGNLSASKVIEDVKKLNDPKEKLRLLRLWLTNNNSNMSELEKVIDLSIDELIEISSSTTLTLDVLKELSAQLPFIKDKLAKQKLYYRFRSLEKDLKDLGLSKNKYIYHLNMFHAEYSIDNKTSLKSIYQIINDVDNVNDTLIRFESFCEIYAKLAILKAEDLKGQINFVYSRILSLSEELFKKTAKHYEIFEYALKTVGKKNPKLGLKICEGMNTVLHRENSRLNVLDAYLTNNIKFINIELLKEFETHFEGSYYREILYCEILKRYASCKGIHFSVIENLQYFFRKSFDINSPTDRLTALLSAYQISSKNDEWKKRLANNLEMQISNIWRKTEADWEKVDVGFIIASETANINKIYAENIFKESETLKNESWTDSNLVAFTYMNNVKLVIRSYTNLIASKTNIPSDYTILEELINRIPSEINKIKLWSEIGFGCHSYSNDEIVHKILNEHILPLAQSIIDNKHDLTEITNSLILIHIFNADLAIEYINRIPKDYREIVIRKICFYYITKNNPYDYYDPNANKYVTTFNDLSKALSLLKLTATDSGIYHLIQNICDAILDNKQIISNPQITALFDKVNQIINDKLPDLKNIRHNGYHILATMKIHAIKKEGISHNTFWIDLIEQANLIPNISDLIFVKAHLLDGIPFDKITNGSKLKNSLFEDVIKKLDSISIHYEFVQRVIDIFELMYHIDGIKWKDVVKKAFAISKELENEADTYSSQKNIIDSMYRLDPNYAKELIKLVDEDNKGVKINSMLKNHLETLEIANKIRNSKTLSEKEKENHRNIVSGIMDSLGSLNSNKMTSKKISEISSYLPLGNKLPLHEVFPVYMFYFTNCAKTYKTKNTTGPLSDLHRQNFKETVQTTNLVRLLSQRRKKGINSKRSFFIAEKFDTNKPVKPGTREECIGYIRDWIADEVSEFIIIVDPYFQKEDLEILKIIKESNSSLEVDIIGSKDGYIKGIDDLFIKHWRTISDENPPFTNITFCWIPDKGNGSPFHDRWIITKNSGLRLGTSLNSLGLSKDSEISVMKPNEAFNILENSLKDYISRRKREINKQKIQYKSFNL